MQVRIHKLYWASKYVTNIMDIVSSFTNSVVFFLQFGIISNYVTKLHLFSFDCYLKHQNYYTEMIEKTVFSLKWVNIHWGKNRENFVFFPKKFPFFSFKMGELLAHFERKNGSILGKIQNFLTIFPSVVLRFIVLLCTNYKHMHGQDRP